MKNTIAIVFVAIATTCSAGQEKRCKVCGNELDEIESFSQSAELCHTHNGFKPCRGNCGKYVNPIHGTVCPECRKKREEERRQKEHSDNQQSVTVSKACAFEFAGYRLGTFPDRRRGVQADTGAPINLSRRFLDIFTMVALKHGEKSHLLEQMLFTSARLSSGEARAYVGIIISRIKRTYGFELKSDGPNRWTCLTDDYKFLMKGAVDEESNVVKLLIIDLKSQEVERRMAANEPPLTDVVTVQQGEKVYPDEEYLNLENGMIYELSRSGTGNKHVRLRALDIETVRRNKGVVKVPSKIVHDDRFPKREQGTFQISDAIRMMNSIAGKWHDENLKLVLDVSDFKNTDLDTLPTNKWDNVGGFVFSKETIAARAELEKKRTEERERERLAKIAAEKAEVKKLKRQAEQARIELANRIKNTTTWESVVKDIYALENDNRVTELNKQAFWGKKRGEKVYWRGHISDVSRMGDQSIRVESKETYLEERQTRGAKASVVLAERSADRRVPVMAEVVFQTETDIEYLSGLLKGSEIMFEGTLERGTVDKGFLDGEPYRRCRIVLSQGRLLPRD